MGVDLHAFFLDFIYPTIFTNISTEISFIPPFFPVFHKNRLIPPNLFLIEWVQNL